MPFFESGGGGGPGMKMTKDDGNYYKVRQTMKTNVTKIMDFLQKMENDSLKNDGHQNSGKRWKLWQLPKADGKYTVLSCG